MRRRFGCSSLGPWHFLAFLGTRIFEISWDISRYLERINVQALRFPVLNDPSIGKGLLGNTKLLSLAKIHIFLAVTFASRNISTDVAVRCLGLSLSLSLFLFLFLFPSISIYLHDMSPLDASCLSLSRVRLETVACQGSSAILTWMGHNALAVLPLLYFAFSLGGQLPSGRTTSTWWCAGRGRLKGIYLKNDMDNREVFLSCFFCFFQALPEFAQKETWEQRRGTGRNNMQSNEIICFQTTGLLSDLVGTITACQSAGPMVSRRQKLLQLIPTVAFYRTFSCAILFGIWYMADVLRFCLAIFVVYLMTFFLAFYLTYRVALFLAFLSGISSDILSGSWGPAVPTGMWSWWLRSGSADRELAERREGGRKEGTKEGRGGGEELL